MEKSEIYDFFAPGGLCNSGQSWSFLPFLALDKQNPTFLTHLVTFSHEGAPNVAQIDYDT